MDYTSLKKLIDNTFTVEECKGYTWKKWNEDENKMESDENYFEGASRKFVIHTDKGILELGAGQLGTLLQSVYYKGKSDINNRTFRVKSNGETEWNKLRYFFDVVEDKKITRESNGKVESVKQQVENLGKAMKGDVVLEDIDEEVDMSDIPY